MNDVPEGTYPFTTIDPSVGEAYVRVECAAHEFEGTGVQRALEDALFEELDAIAVFPGSAGGDPEDGKFMRDCFVLPEGSTTEDFAYFLDSDIGEGLLHGIDCRNGRQIGAGHELEDRDVIRTLRVLIGQRERSSR